MHSCINASTQGENDEEKKNDERNILAAASIAQTNDANFIASQTINSVIIRCSLLKYFN